MTEPTLHLKTYFSSTVEAAVDLARRELGPEAMLMNSRKSPAEARHLGLYEVVFAGSLTAEPTNRGHYERWTPAPAAEQMNCPSEIADIRAKLHDTGMDTALVRQLTEAAMATRTPHPVRTSSAPESDSLHAAVRREMEKRITVDSHLGREGSRRTVVAFVGPPGRGKTTTLVKVAITCGLAKRIPVRIFSMDARRIAADEQMRSYAAILAVPFQSFENVAGLDQALAAGWGQDARTETLTLIDTAGYGPGEMAEAGQLAAYLASNSEIDVHLVLRADTRTADLVRAVERYSMFRPGKLIFTGLDEAESFGAGFSAAVRCGLPVSFLSAGQRVPEDIYPAAGGQLAGLVLTGGAYQKRAAA